MAQALLPVGQPGSLQAVKWPCCFACPADDALPPVPLNDDEAVEMRSQLDTQIREAASQDAFDNDEAALAHGREVWSRCEALTAGIRPAFVSSLLRLGS